MVALNIRIYTSNPSIRLHWACWDDDYVVFDETSGQTQKMGPLRAYLLNALSVKAYRFDDLLQELANVPGLSNDSSLTELVKTVLDEFVQSGLVEVTVE